MSARRRFAIGTTGAGVILALAAARTMVLLAGSGPDTARLADTAPPVPLGSGMAVEQSFFLPACQVRVLRVALASAVERPSTVHVEVLRADNPGWPSKPVLQTTVHLPASSQAIDVVVPQPLDTWRRVFAVHLSLSAGPPVSLATRVAPAAWPGALRVNGAWQGRHVLALRAVPDVHRTGTLECMFDAGSRTLLIALLVAVGVVLLATVLVVGVLCAAGRWSASARQDNGAAFPRWLSWLPAVLALAAGLVWLLAVPPFEGPDEMAHVQYARFVAVAGTLPSELPGEASPWRHAYYEWVQQPLYYVASGLMLHAVGTFDAPSQDANPRSILAGGRERTVYRHSGPPPNDSGHAALYLMRVLNLSSSVGIVVLIALLLRRSCMNPLLSAWAACCLALVPQWSAILTMAGNDAPATLTTTIACVLLVRMTSGDVSARTAALAGAAVGGALATKLTTWFLLPMAACALLAPAVARHRLRVSTTLCGTVALTSGWVLVRNLVVFGDPVASAFKRAILERSGFLAASAAQPPPGTPAFWATLRAQVFEAFWARFGSLGAGPDAASRVWLVYAALTVLIAVVIVAGAAHAWRRARVDPEREWGGLVLAIGVGAGLAGWIWINLAVRADTIVHWTPRHVLPLSAPLVFLAGVGVDRLRAMGVAPLSGRVAASMVVIVLAAAWLAVLGHVVQQFAFGY